MSKKVLIIGAVALGPKVACRLRRIDPDVEITMIDRDELISYGGCGIPYYVGGDVADIEGLRSTIAHAIRDAEFFKATKGAEVLTGVEAVAIKRAEKKVVVRHLKEDREEEMPYDQLVIATGATPMRPPIPGADLPQVHVVSNLHHAKAIKDAISKGEVENAVVIGAGAIGIEMAEAFTDLWGIDTTLIEMADQVLPQALGKDMSRIAEKKLREHGVELLLSQRVMKINGDAENGVQSVETQEKTIPCSMVILAAGVRPNSQLAADAGLALGRCGGVLVNRRMQTSDPNIFSGGDCAEFPNLISGQEILMPLGSLANRQGRIIATNLNGGAAQFPGAVGAFCIKIFDMGMAKAGLTTAQAAAAGFDPVDVVVAQSDRAHFFPDADFMFMKLIADRKSRKILGVEAAGPQGDAVKARVDAVAPLLKFGVDVDEIANLEVSYAPPYASAMDIVNNAGNALDNTLNGSLKSIDTWEFLEKFKNENARVVDVRSTVQAEPFVEKYGDQWLNIPQDEFRKRVNEIPKDEPIYMLCGTGPRSYECQVILAAHGITNSFNIQGGYGMILAIHEPLV
ncbi:NADPH-dependent 2,4-dienoyl-CoA reductase, sulfur reductase [Desulfocicer vacuolatum DSM 3385]|uniref:NADPH-dependent 2,4-dienoyl-CoA reductase, sulfur reductase n=1 Tax=Desulfocicer vacuolatum DSM 3385 TaxID=1121400 RepID=A0A1W2BRR6_9BACT|nr:FAD-dependent oxidoreductase [Desulfocicer vacuolatum]SMC75643.1 NADPH-dependent 2,4-dienoyl-CoA reductase, sulfur reductase [Desulfocicer vacuolatum DSM 3385]